MTINHAIALGKPLLDEWAEWHRGITGRQPTEREVQNMAEVLVTLGLTITPGSDDDVQDPGLVR
jgi:hypothetical protein